MPQLGPYVVIGRILLAPAIYALMLLAIYIATGSRALIGETFGRSLMVFVIGKFSALGVQGEPLYWILVLGTVDVLVGLFLIWNFYVLFRVPGIGPLMRFMENKGSRFLEQNNWVRRVAFTAVILIVVVPFQGTGAVMGSIVGRFIGLGRWRTLVAIAIGGYTGFALFVYGNRLIALLGSLDPLIAIGVTTFLIATGFVVWWHWFRVRRRDEGQDTEEGSTDPAVKKSKRSQV